MKSLKTGFTSVMLLVTLLIWGETTAQKISYRPILPFAISPCETQLTVALDTLHTFELRLANQKQQTSTALDLYHNAQQRGNKLDTLLSGSVAFQGKLITAYQQQRDRADLADSLLAPYQKKVCKYEGCTWAGRQVRKVDKGVKYFGYGSVAVALLKLFVFR